MQNALQPAEELQLYEDYGLWHVPFWQKGWFIACSSIAALLLLGLIGYIIFRKIQAKKKILSPRDQAIHDLQMLKKKGLCVPAMSNAFYTRLTAILKRYLSFLYAEDFLSYTDHQMVDRILHMPLFDAEKEGFSQVFLAGELIKFAAQDAVADRMEQDWQFCFNFVQHSLKENLSSAK